MLGQQGCGGAKVETHTVLGRPLSSQLEMSIDWAVENGKLGGKESHLLVDWVRGTVFPGFRKEPDNFQGEYLQAIFSDPVILELLDFIRL